MLNSDPFDPDNLRLPDAERERVSKNPPRHRPGEKFLKWPIPWLWIQQAARLPGSALHVGLLLWFDAGCRKCRTFPINQARASEFHLSTQTMRRGLRELEAEKLVSMRHLPGRCLEVTIREAVAIQRPVPAHPAKTPNRHLRNGEV
jgi:hypothetical protein